MSYIHVPAPVDIVPDRNIAVLIRIRFLWFTGPDPALGLTSEPDKNLRMDANGLEPDLYPVPVLIFS
jgi:hypothetical protein